MTTATAGLIATDLRVRFGDRIGLRIDRLAIAPGERVALLGPSGVGKTSLLRALAGLGRLAGGHLIVDGRDVTDAPPERRGVVYMHQTPLLFPHLSVEDNVAFPLVVRGCPRHEARARAQAWLQRVQLGELAQRAIATLSGGQHHRVALARALAAEPAVLLLDEPFASLDPELRGEVKASVLGLLSQAQSPSLLIVTHDIDEAASLAGRLVVLMDGRVAQSGPASEVLAAPQSLPVARFLGLANLLTGHREGGVVTWPLGRIASAGLDGPVTVTFRPGSARICPSRSGSCAGTVADIVEGVSGRLVGVVIGGATLLGIPSATLTVATGTPVTVEIDEAAVHVIDGGAGK